jgi:hypothetical protein
MRHLLVSVLLLIGCSHVDVSEPEPDEPCDVCPPAAVCAPPLPSCDGALKDCYAAAAYCMSECQDDENVAQCVKLCAVQLPQCEALCPST